jgi:uracil-DNA glycosylase family protein
MLPPIPRASHALEQQEEAPMPTTRKPEDAAPSEAEHDELTTLAALNRVIAASEPFVEGGTKAVLGEGPVGAAIAFVGEQPGDQEDLEGRPFVGPAGQLLDRAMEAAGIDRQASYLTNAVKHFKFELQGKRRIHQSPTVGEVKHYRWWLMKELDLVAPRLVVALGATAAMALAGRPVAVTKVRGEMRFDQWRGYITVHPSYLLRQTDELSRQSAYQAFVADLARVRELTVAGSRARGRREAR